MKIICDRTLLSAAVSGVSKAVTQRSSIPVLEGILLKAEGFQLTLTGYDLEMGITTSFPQNCSETSSADLQATKLRLRLTKPTTPPSKAAFRNSISQV